MADTYGFGLANLCTLDVEELVVTDDVHNAINHYLLSLLGQNYVLDTLFVTAPATRTEVQLDRLARSAFVGVILPELTEGELTVCDRAP